MNERELNRKTKRSGVDRAAKVAELEYALEIEKNSHLASKNRLEREIDDLRDLLIQATSAESIMELELKHRIESLEEQLEETAAKLARANKKAANLWMQKVDLETQSNYSPFSKTGWLVMSGVVISAIGMICLVAEIF